MTKEAFYFPHDSNARSDPKIMQMLSVYKSEGYGWYWMLIEMMREQENYKLPIKGKYTINAYAKELDADAKLLQDFINDCISEFTCNGEGLFCHDDNYLWSESLLRRMKIKEEKQEAARRAAFIRWDKMPKSDVDYAQDNAVALRTHNESNADESKIDAIKIKEKKYIKKYIKKRKAKEIWGNTLPVIKELISKSNYNTWFSNSIGLGMEDEIIFIEVPNSVTFDYLNNNQKSLIEKSLMQVSNLPLKVEFAIKENGNSNAVTKRELIKEKLMEGVNDK